MSLIIDTHTHIGLGDEPSEDAKRLIESMDLSGITHACVFAGTSGFCRNEELLEVIERNRDRLTAVASVSPLDESTRPTVQTVRSWLENGEISGIKFYVGYEHFYPADPVLRPYLELLVDFDKPAVFHSGDLFKEAVGAKLKYAMPIHVDDLATDIPELQIVIAHMGWPWVVDAALVCSKNKNVYADVSGFVYGEFDAVSRNDFREAVRQFVKIADGTESLIFGTDWPISDQKSYADVVREVVGDDAEAVFAGTAAKVFAISI